MTLTTHVISFKQHPFQMCYNWTLNERPPSLKIIILYSYGFFNLIFFFNNSSILVSGLLKSTEQFMETSVDECFSLHNPNDDDSGQRHKMLSACRRYKEIFKEVRGRAITALGFAKMLQKDLGIASKYKMNVSFEAILRTLRESKHYKVCSFISLFVLRLISTG